MNKKIFLITLTYFIGLFHLSCQKSIEPTELSYQKRIKNQFVPYPRQKITGIHFENTIEPWKQELLHQDFETLQRIYFIPSSSLEQLRVMLELETISAKILLQYIQDYFHILIGTNSQTFLRTDDPSIRMSNMGATLYTHGKGQIAIPEVFIEGVGNVLIDTPLIGIFQEGKEFFSSSGIPILDTICRLSTILHEIRHNFGNTEANSLIFAHKTCSRGNLYNRPICDSMINGPYMISFLFIKSFIQSCSWCSDLEKEPLQVLTAEFYDRLDTATLRQAAEQYLRDPNAEHLSKYPYYSDPTPEGVL